tara:strand:- start:9077 stop:9784 length:708 start_codon:yes stop_codon:yes gene_type:complete
MQFTSLLKLSLSTPFFLSSHTYAGLIESDVFTKNDSLAFSLDIEGYNLQWLDFGQTNNLTFTDAKKLTNTGGIYEGWRVANHDEVLFLWEDIFFSQSTNTKYDYPERGEIYNGATGELAKQFFTTTLVMGFNQSEVWLIRSTGYFNSESSTIAWSAGVQFNFRDQELVSSLARYVGSDSYGNAVGSAYAGQNKSTFLVREQSVVSVNEPPAILMMLLAFIVFFKGRGKHHAKYFK